MRRSEPVKAALAAPRPFRWLSAVSDRWIVAAAISTAIGALWAPQVSWRWGAAAAAVGISTRARVLIPAGLLILGAASMGVQIAALEAASGGTLDGEAILTADPEWRAGALVVPFSAEINGERFRWEGRTRGPPAWAAEDAAMGERWHLSASTEPAEDRDRDFMWSRHVAGSAQITAAHRIDGGAVPFRFANRVRGLVSESGASLSQRDAALLAGFVYGDDRGQLPEVVHDFRATSLTHLLAVSGSNVAFVLLLFAPLLVRLRPLLRLGAVGLLLAQFAVLTRGEPSVLRACVLATLAVGAHAIGRRASAPRLLATAVIVLLLIDPLLVRSVGFQLSVAATAAIVFWAGRVAGLLWGPPWLRLALAATLVAQAGVLPVQLAVFGSLPLASIPANVGAGPIAGPAMVWGLVAGLAGGLAGDAVAAVLHLPTRLLLGWVASVARWGADLGWPNIELAEIGGIGLVAGACIAAGLSARRHGTAVRGLVIAAFAVGVWVVADSHRTPPPSGAHLTVHRIHPTVVVVDRPDASRALDRLATAGIDGIDVLVARSASRAGREAVRALAARHEIGRVLAPEGLGGSVPYTPVRSTVTVGGLRVAASAERLEATPATPAVASEEWQAEP
ncbi:ComEC/Rec2 family competence protein [Candidatus Poriferisodalis sp.]|uniref:ComEC/Rec2 family competence protein n=1 Tax=Candidatus Poriferisodalis sp. TaxID=3101277 RepID=UPI003B025E4D